MNSNILEEKPKKIVIAHRGASGYLPEHTLQAKALAYQMGVDYLEQDLAMTKDNQLVVVHDRFLDRVTDVADKFTTRARADGRYYVIDFTLEEIKSLNFTEGFTIKNGIKVANYPNRFPINKSTFKIHTFREEIEFIQGLNKTMGKNVGLYVETKAPWFHKMEGKDISKATLEVLKEYGYTSKESKVYFQTFDFPDLIYVKEKLIPAMNMNIKTILLFAENNWLETYEQDKDGSYKPFDFDKLRTKEGFYQVVKYADGVGPSYNMVIDNKLSKKGNIVITDFVELAHQNKLAVHPYTVRKDNLPHYVEDVYQLFEILLYQAKVDGLFTDFPDLCVNYINNRHK